LPAATAGTTSTAERTGTASLASLTPASYAEFGRPLERLPGTAAETDALRALFSRDPSLGGLRVLQGADATESALRARLADHRYLHLATHGLVAERRADLFSALALTPPGGASPDTRDDGFLQLHEIYDLALDDVQLAVLSACESNVGSRVEGEGVFALSRGFLAAGARRVIASQWAVNDTSTAVLIGAFFETIVADERAGRRVDYAAALREAKRRVRTHPDHPEWAAPYYWAPFVLVGMQ
jgi:CHAT domain-containing protein